MIPLKVVPADLGLSGNFGNASKRAEGRFLTGGTAQNRVPHRLQRGSSAPPGSEPGSYRRRSPITTGVAASSPCMIARGIHFHFFGRESCASLPRSDPPGKVLAGPLMVLSIPFRTSTTPLDLLDGIRDLRRPFLQQCRIGAEKLDLHRFRCAGQIADHILQQLYKFHCRASGNCSAILSLTSAVTSSTLRSRSRFSLTAKSPVLASVTAARPSCMPGAAGSALHFRCVRAGSPRCQSARGWFPRGRSLPASSSPG